MKLSREEAWAGTLESMVDNRVVFYLRRYNRDYQDYSRQMKELCEKYPAIIQLIDGNNGVTLNDEEYQVFKTYSELSSNREIEEIEKILKTLSEDDSYGMILRAKGMLESEDGVWTYFDMVPEEVDIREGSAEYTGRICVIGSKLDEAKLEQLWFAK